MGVSRTKQPVTIFGADGLPINTTSGAVNIDITSDSVGLATQATLSAADTKLGTIDSTLDSIKDTDGIKKITDPLPAGTNNIGDVDLASSIPAGTNEIGKVANVDANGNALDMEPDANLPGTARSNLIMGQSDDATPQGRIPTVTTAQDQRNRVAIEGPVTLAPPEAPPASTPVRIAITAAEPDLATTDDTVYVITNGTTFNLTYFVSGSEGDGSERGSKVEVWYWDGTTEYLIARSYVNGANAPPQAPNTDTARDATTVMTGDGTNEIRVRRTRLSGQTQEVDFDVFGYEV